jgi:hypothetical protein
MGTSGLLRDWRFSGLSDDDDGKNAGLKWKLAESMSKYKNTSVSSNAAVFLLMTIADSPLLGQFDSVLNFYYDSGRYLPAD